MNRKGQGIGLNVIIVAAIALLVLVVLAVLIFRSGGQVGSAGECSNFDGLCVLPDEQCPGGYGNSVYSCNEGEKCCIPIIPE